MKAILVSIPFQWQFRSKIQVCTSAILSRNKIRIGSINPTKCELHKMNSDTGSKRKEMARCRQKVKASKKT